MTIGIPVGPTACVHCGKQNVPAIRANWKTRVCFVCVLPNRDEIPLVVAALERLATAEALALANGEARERAEAEVARLKVDMEEMVEAAGRHTELDAKLERLANGLTENGLAIDAAVVARAERAEAERDESRGLLDRIVTAWDDDDISAATQHARLARLTGEARRFLASHPAAIPEGTPTAEPVTFAAVKISRCPNCNEFPEQWQSGGMPCTECGVDLESNIRADTDGAELWEFDFADQADYDKKHAPEGTPGEGTGRP